VSNAQLYLTIGIPSFLVVLAWITTSMQNNRSDAKQDRIAESLRLEMRTDRAEVTALINLLSGRVDIIIGKLMELSDRISVMEGKHQ
jgi:hypothetical protein